MVSGAQGADLLLGLDVPRPQDADEKALEKQPPAPPHAAMPQAADDALAVALSRQSALES